jgi:hypothetical protein
MDIDLSAAGLIGTIVGLLVIIATILTAINTARIADSLKRIERLLDRQNSN